MTRPPIPPLVYDPAAALVYPHGLTPDELESVRPQLSSARAEVLADLELLRSGESIPPHKHPLDAGFMDLPDRLLADYESQRDESELGRILATAHRLQESVDRVVVLGIGGSYMGARALMESCCHPYHNELTRAARGGRPRLYFEGNNVDNDAAAGLLDLLPEQLGSTADETWGIVVISKSGGTLETAAAFRTFLARLQQGAGGDKDRVAQLVVPVTGQQGKLRDLSQALGCPDVFDIPDGVGGRFSIFTAVGLLPAAILGLDIVRLLEGAAVMNERFRTADFGSNPVLDYVGVCHAAERFRGQDIRILSMWSKGLEAAGLWYDQLLSESLGKQGSGATPITVVNTRDLHSRGQQHQEGARDKLITNVYPMAARRDPIAIQTSDLNQDLLNELAGKTLPKILRAALEGTNQAYFDDRRPTTSLRFAQLDEPSLGQFFQMMMLATAVEGRMIGINPYGQPGVEAYKANMNRILRS